VGAGWPPVGGGGVVGAGGVAAGRRMLRWQVASFSKAGDRKRIVVEPNAGCVCRPPVHLRSPPSKLIPEFYSEIERSGQGKVASGQVMRMCPGNVCEALLS